MAAVGIDYEVAAVVGTTGLAGTARQVLCRAQIGTELRQRTV